MASTVSLFLQPLLLMSKLYRFSKILMAMLFGFMCNLVEPSTSIYPLMVILYLHKLRNAYRFTMHQHLEKHNNTMHFRKITAETAGMKIY